MKDRSPVNRWHTCAACGKRAYLSRAEAKQVAKHMPDGHMFAYRCGDFWHLGNLPPSVARGNQDRPRPRP